MSANWTIRRLNDKATVRAFLNRDRVYNAYMLGDLENEHWPLSAFFGAFLPDTDQPDALVLRYNGFEPGLLVLSGEPAGVTAILNSMALATPVYITATETLRPLLEPFYTLDSCQYMWRMVYEGGEVAADVAQGTQLLTTPADADRIETLFTDRREDSLHFTRSQLAGGAFYGVTGADGALIAVSGTHLVSRAESVAGVGNIYTDPDWRGHGYATRCTAATTRALFSEGVQTIVLNVEQRNHAAIHIYEKLGYRRALPFWEGIAQPRQAE